MNLNSLLEQAKIAASMASEEILKVYHSGDFEIEAKDDQSPLTRADQAAHQVIAAVLEKTSFPILSEEGAQIPFFTKKKLGNILADRPLRWYERIYQKKWRIHREHCPYPSASAHTRCRTNARHC